MGNTVSKIEQHIEEGRRLLAELKQQILDLPDNPNISRTGDKGFVIMRSQLGGNLSAQYHDFKHTYRKLVEHLEGADLQNVGRILRTAIENGWFRHANQRFDLHPQVIENLRTLIGYDQGRQ